MQRFDKAFVNNILNTLDEESYLFPQFGFTKENGELKLLGVGGFSSVFEMFNKERQDSRYALKVTGFQRHTVSSEDFWNTSRIQWVLCQESKYIMRILDEKEYLVFLDSEGGISEISAVTNEAWEKTGEPLHLQFALTEKLEVLFEQDRCGNLTLRDELHTEAEVLKFAIEIGHALALAHDNNFLHRDIKLENTFWDSSENVYKLGDFGTAKLAEDGNAETRLFTNGYGAPEIERGLNQS